MTRDERVMEILTKDSTKYGMNGLGKPFSKEDLEKDETIKFIKLIRNKDRTIKMLFCKHNFKRIKGTNTAKCAKCQRVAIVNALEGYLNNESD